MKKLGFKIEYDIETAINKIINYYKNKTIN